MLRLAALALIVAAFARPFLRGTTLAAAGRRRARRRDPARPLLQHGPRRSVGARAARGGRRGRRARADGDRASLVLFATTAEVAVQPTDDRARLQSEINARRQLSAGATRYGPALKLAGSLLRRSNLPRREVVLISDFQRSGWSPGDGLRLPAGTVLTPVVGAGRQTRERRGDAGDDSARTVFRSGARHRHRRRAQSQRRGGHRPAGVARDRRPRGADDAGVAAAARRRRRRRSRRSTFTSPNTRGAVRIGDDALAADNAFHFVLSPPRPVP